MKSLPDMLRRTMPALLGKQNMGWGDLRLLLEQWDTIIGDHYAAVTSPVSLKFPVTGGSENRQTERREGTLTIAAPAALRTEIQHDSTMIIERINRTFGYTAVARLLLVPSTQTLRAAQPAPPRPIKLDPALLAGIEDPELRERLTSLAAHMGAETKG